MSANGTQSAVNEGSDTANRAPRNTSDARLIETDHPATGTDGAASGPRTASGSIHRVRHDRSERLKDVANVCSKAVMRRYDEEAILAECCRMLVEQTGYAMSWIGHLDPDSRRMLPVAQAGIPPEFRLPSRDPGAGEDPVERALAQDRVVIRNAIREGDSPHLRAHAHRHGYDSLCVVPLTLRGIRGVLSVYAKEADAFNAQEAVLLRELASDVTQGIALLHEINEQERRLESDNAQNKKQYDGFFKEAREGIFIASPGGTLRLVNPAFARLLGYDDPDDLQGSTHVNLYTIMTPHDKNRLMECLGPRPVPPLELGLRRRDASTTWVGILATRFEHDGTPHIKATVQDLSTMRERREAIKQVEALADTGDLAIIRKDIDGRIESWNPGATRLYGHEAEEAVGRWHTFLFADDPTRKDEQNVCEAVRASRRVPPYEARRQAKDGSPLEVCVSVSPIPGPGGRPRGLWVIEHEITRNVVSTPPVTTPAGPHGPPLDARLLAQTTQAINTNLTPVFNHVELIQSAGPLKNPQATSLDVIRRNLRQTARLVAHLREAARVHAQPPRLVKKPTRLDGVIHHALENVQESARSRKVVIECKSPPSCVLPMDRFHVRHAVSTLFEHAVKQAPAGGRIRIRTLMTKQTVRILIEDHTGRPAASPGDTGRPPAKKRADEEDHPALCVARKIIEHHGGRLWTRRNGHTTAPRMSLVLPVEAAGRRPDSRPVRPAARKARQRSRQSTRAHPDV